MKERVVLAYSGGLDTTVAVGWLREALDADVICVAADVGQGGDFEALRERALMSGAVEAVVVDGTDEFAEDYLRPTLAANALYQGRYPLVSALSRPLICHHLVQAAAEFGAGSVAHGCTGKGNDQVRFEVSLGALAPHLKVLAPVRGWGMTREETQAWGIAHGLPVATTSTTGAGVPVKAPYSIDENLWGRAIECGQLEDPMAEAPDDVWERTVPPSKAPTDPAYCVLTFEAGVPVAVDGERLPLAQLIRRVDALAGSFGVGRLDMVEDRVVGIKSREVYEVAGALVLIDAHRDLEALVLDRDVLRTKRGLEARYAELVYEGQWFSPLREALDAFNANTQQYVSGDVRVKLEPGSARVVGRSAPGSLYDLSLATYDIGDTFEHGAAEGFVKLWGLPLKTWARARGRS
ncbi:MAG TPA: argininosuccinate synthase [Actinomycetota bacterium]|nr:argininosuccinate synthase [Actinomycetota bacterium]